jgi:hypothetical protein
MIGEAERGEEGARQASLVVQTARRRPRAQPWSTGTALERAILATMLASNRGDREQPVDLIWEGSR